MKRLSRIDLIKRIAEQSSGRPGRVLNLGCKQTRLGTVNADIGGSPDVFADARLLPFRDAAFSLVVFSEVLEHLPRGTEARALQEINRVLTRGGVLVLSTPSSDGIWGKLYWLADPAFWLVGHRHYAEASLRRLLAETGFKIEQFMIRGGFRDMLFSVITPCVYLSRKLRPTNYPDLGSDYSFENSVRGYTLIALAQKSISVTELPVRVHKGLHSSAC